ncbi:hypothetical protein COOONC_23776 [Cooperia oncophora]
MWSLIENRSRERQISVKALYVGLVLVVAGALARLASGFAIVACSPLNLGEQFIVVWSLFPKGTVQAALGPNLFTLAEKYPQFKRRRSIIRMF